MTAPTTARPDPLKAVLDAHPGELDVAEDGRTLVITAPEVQGSIRVSPASSLPLLAQEVSRALLALRNAPSRCECGESETTHDLTERAPQRRTRCLRHGCPCTAFTPREVA
jgi:hypothetical protein